MTKVQRKLLDIYCSLGECPTADAIFLIRCKGELYRYIATLSLN